MRAHARDGVDTTTPPPSSDRCRERFGSVYVSFDVGAIDVGGLT